MIVFKSLLLFVGLNVATAACPIQTVTSQGAQECLNVLGFVNHTIHSTDEVCSVYQESTQCVKRQIHSQGLDCTIGDIATSIAAKLPNVGFDFTLCNVTDETGSLCTSDSRLSQYAFLACSPYLDIMQTMGVSSMACAYAPSLMDCAQKSMQYLGTTCTQHELTNALKSTSATTLLSTQHAGLDLSQCFQTETVTDSVCTNHVSIFSNGGVLQCMGLMPYLNLTNLIDPDSIATQCSFLQEIESCMVQQLKQAGSSCTVLQMKSSISTYIQLSPPDGVVHRLGPLGVCPANDTYVTSSMCDNEFRIVAFFSTSGKSLFESMASLPNMKDYVCTTLSSYSQTLLQPIGVKCIMNQIFAALTSSYGNSVFTRLYPGLDLNHCLHMSGGV